MKKYSRIITTSYSEDPSVQHNTFIENLDTIEFKKNIELLSKKISEISEADYDELFGCLDGEYKDRFEFVKEKNGELTLFDENTVKVLIEDSKYTLSGTNIATFKDSFINEIDNLDTEELFNKFYNGDLLNYI